jgi:tetratricopeptide (TPR) repeat protein
VVRLVLFVSLIGVTAGLAQDAAQSPEKQVPAIVPESSQVSPEVSAAEAELAKSNWKAAEAKLDPWLAAHPTDARALFDAGYVADAENRLDDAAGLYKRAVEANPNSFEAQLSLGLVLARQGKLEEARPALAAATALDPGEAGAVTKARAWRALAVIDRPGPGRPGDAATASSDLLQALKLSPEMPEDTLLAAGLAEDAGQYDTAEAAYRRVLAKDPKSAAAQAGLAHLLIERKEYPAAETMLRAALEQSPDDPALTAQLATVLAAQDKAEALPLIQKLHDAHPRDPAITRMLAAVLADAGDAVGSDHLYLELLAASPADPVLLIGHGQNLLHQLKYQEAYQTFNKATAADPANADGWSGLAFSASKISQPQVTIHALTMRARYLPEVPSTYFLWATAYDNLHDKASASAYYHHFLESSKGKFPDQEWQARQRLLLLDKK